jgi:hypothetical protein
VGVRSRSAADAAGRRRRPFAHELKRVDQVLEAERLGEHGIEAGREGIGSGCRAGIRTDRNEPHEATAGEHGPIKLSADGSSFVRGDGRSIRFWAANAGRQNSMQDVETQVRFLAKKGVNMIRLHRSIPSAKEGAKITDMKADSGHVILRIRTDQGDEIVIVDDVSGRVVSRVIAPK